MGAIQVEGGAPQEENFRSAHLTIDTVRWVPFKRKQGLHRKKTSGVPNWPVGGTFFKFAPGCQNLWLTAPDVQPPEYASDFGQENFFLI